MSVATLSAPGCAITTPGEFVAFPAAPRLPLFKEIVWAHAEGADNQAQVIAAAANPIVASLLSRTAGINAVRSETVEFVE